VIGFSPEEFQQLDMQVRGTKKGLWNDSCSIVKCCCNDKWLTFFFFSSLTHWTSCLLIATVRMVCAFIIDLHIFRILSFLFFKLCPATHTHFHSVLSRKCVCVCVCVFSFIRKCPTKRYTETKPDSRCDSKAAYGGQAECQQWRQTPAGGRSLLMNNIVEEGAKLKKN
jgi:hypothetical protein